MSARPILIVEDDAALRATLAEQLIADGSFLPGEAVSAADAEAMLGAADARYDAILLDVGLPDGDGRDLCAKLRRGGMTIPVIMLTGADGEQDVVRRIASSRAGIAMTACGREVPWAASAGEGADRRCIGTAGQRPSDDAVRTVA
jgi:CheY-like chemotaxis protein